MMICGVKLKYAIWIVIGALFLTHSKMAPLGAVILAGTYMRAMADAKKMDRECAMKMRKAGTGYEEVDVAYPDTEDEFDSDEFLNNLRGMGIMKVMR